MTVFNIDFLIESLLENIITMLTIRDGRHELLTF